MRLSSLNKITEKSDINYDYKTIRITKSRIEKGLIAIPKGFSNYLPNSNQKIKVYFNNSDDLQIKTFSSFESSTNENRIGGLKNWFFENKVREGDELVLIIIDKEKFIYRLIKEEDFLKKTIELQTDFDNSKDEKIAIEKLEMILSLTQVGKTIAIYNEFLRLSRYSNEDIRKRLKISKISNKEKTPFSIKMLLGNIYKGQCQVCSFTFLKKDQNPYFEIHHIDALLSHHPKNLVLVCANCHRQFEYADILKDFSADGWLKRVFFNQKEYFIKQAINEIEKQEFLKTIYL